MAGMRWREIDFDKRVWVLPAGRAKNNRELSLPLSDITITILRDAPRKEPQDFVFSLTGRNPIAAFGNIKKQLDARLGRSMICAEALRVAAHG